MGGGVARSNRTENALKMQRRRSCFILIQSSFLCMGGETHTSVEHNRRQVNTPSALTDTDKHTTVQEQSCAEDHATAKC